MSNVRVIKKGEAVFKEGEVAQTIFLVQSGSVELQVRRQKGHVSLCLLGSGQVLGEHALTGSSTHPHTAVAVAETKIIELPVEAVRAQVEAGTQIVKVLIKGLSDKLKAMNKDYQSMKLERDSMPCPPEQTAKIFGTLYHVAMTKGEKTPQGHVRVPWPLMKQYAQRIFLESPRRLEMAANVFVKLSWAKFEMVKDETDPEGPEQIGFVHFFDLPVIEQFFEFYQYYFFKGGKQELLKTDDRAIQLAGAILAATKETAIDRHGSVRLSYSQVVESVKEQSGIQLNTDHFGLLQKKGLFVKRQSSDDGIFIYLEPKEFDRTLKTWLILRETERWNEAGFVDPNAPVELVKQAGKTSASCCPQCSHGYESSAKFCPECGFKLVTAA